MPDAAKKVENLAESRPEPEVREPQLDADTIRQHGRIVEMRLLGFEMAAASMERTLLKRLGRAA